MLYRSDCGPSLCPERCRPEVFAGEIQFCSTAVSSGEYPWGASNRSLRPERAGPRRPAAPPAASWSWSWSSPQTVSARSASRPGGYPRSRKRLQLPPEGRQTPQPWCWSGAGKVQRGGPEAALLRTSLPGGHLLHVYLRVHGRTQANQRILRSRLRRLGIVLYWCAAFSVGGLPAGSCQRSCRCLAQTQVVPQQRGGAGRVCARSAGAAEAGAKPAGLWVGGTFTVQACPGRITPTRSLSLALFLFFVFLSLSLSKDER